MRASARAAVRRRRAPSTRRPRPRLPRGGASGAFRRALAEQTLGAEHEDQDQDREDDRLRPVATGGMPAQPLVERLDEPDAERAEHGAGEIPDAAEHGSSERDESELEAGVVANLAEVQRVEQAGGAREGA